MLKEGEALAFHMALHLLDVICVRNLFFVMNLSWHVANFLFMPTSASYGRTCKKNLMPLFAMNSSPEFISLYLKRNAQGCM
jgi:hypothetical protein